MADKTVERKPKQAEEDKPDGSCGNECAFVQPYGWVPEADCPIHDPPQHRERSDER